VKEDTIGGMRLGGTFLSRVMSQKVKILIQSIWHKLSYTYLFRLIIIGMRLMMLTPPINFLNLDQTGFQLD
jgi:hypothetical protein